MSSYLLRSSNSYPQRQLQVIRASSTRLSTQNRRICTATIGSLPEERRRDQAGPSRAPLGQMVTGSLFERPGLSRPPTNPASRFRSLGMFVGLQLAADLDDLAVDGHDPGGQVDRRWSGRRARPSSARCRRRSRPSARRSPSGRPGPGRAWPHPRAQGSPRGRRTGRTLPRRSAPAPGPGGPRPASALPSAGGWPGSRR